MRVNITQPVNHDVVYVELCVPVNYDEDDMPNDFPCRTEDQWEVRIDIENGELWDTGGWRFPPVSRSLHMKVVDNGTYKLLNRFGEAVIERQCGVPGFFPGEHFGDYLILEMEAGRVTNWKVKPSQVEKWVAND
jgi:hypothetical protein